MLSASGIVSSKASSRLYWHLFERCIQIIPPSTTYWAATSVACCLSSLPQHRWPRTGASNSKILHVVCLPARDSLHPCPAVQVYMQARLSRPSRSIRTVCPSSAFAGVVARSIFGLPKARLPAPAVRTPRLSKRQKQALRIIRQLSGGDAVPSQKPTEERKPGRG
jgi:hypothetical protein